MHMPALRHAAFLAASVLLSSAMAQASLKIGDTAPDFSLPDQAGRIVRLSEFRGKQTVVLAFYVRAGTPG
jgi:peroxiredoxin Q/BCP